MDYRKGWDNLDFFGKYDIKQDLDVFPYDIRDDYYDYILVNHSLEHTLKADQVLYSLYKSLKNDGVMMVSLPIYSNTPQHRTMIHNELYLRSLFVKARHGRVHPQDEGRNITFRSGIVYYSEFMPIGRILFQIYIRFKGWFLSFFYNSINWELKK